MVIQTYKKFSAIMDTPCKDAILMDLRDNLCYDVDRIQ
jgi:hypothetical protein